MAESDGVSGSCLQIICQFLFIAYSSGSELETQVEIVKRLIFGKILDYVKVDNLLNEVMRMLNKMTHDF